MAHSADFGLTTLLQVNVPVRDLDRAVGFYRDVLGLPLHAHREGLAFFSVGPVRLLVERIEEEAGRYAHPSSVLYFSVPDIHEAHQALAGRGVSFIEAPKIVTKNATTETWMAFFEDGDWNTHALASVVPVDSSEAS